MELVDRFNEGNDIRKDMRSDARDVLSERREDLKDAEGRINDARRRVLAIQETPTKSPTNNTDDEDEEERHPFHRNSTEPLPKWRGMLIRVWAVTFGFQGGKNPYPLSKLSEKEKTERIENIERDIKNFERDIEECTQALKLASGKLPYGKVPYELLAVYGEKYEHGRFNMTLLQRVRKDSRLIGQFAGIQGNVMTYDRGGYCWHIDRETSVDFKLVCNNENKIVMLLEPTPCEYHGVFATPAVCQKTHSKAFQNYTLEELDDIFEEHGI
jgi:hypothetical protein